MRAATRRVGSTKPVVSCWRNAHFHKTARSADRMVAFSGGRLGFKNGDSAWDCRTFRPFPCPLAGRLHRAVAGSSSTFRARRPDGPLNGLFCVNVRFVLTKLPFLWLEPPGPTPQVTRARRPDPPGDRFSAHQKCCKIRGPGSRGQLSIAICKQNARLRWLRTPAGQGP